jgi:hypothetical protein
MVLTVSSALSPVTGLVVTVIRVMRSIIANLTPASGRQDHTALPYARVPFVVRHARIHRIPSRVSDDHDTPLCWGRTAGNKPVIWSKNKAEYFF